jgi:glucokinase
MIILGGGVMEACGDYILPRVQKISEKDPFLKGIDKCVIVESVLGDDAVIYGAVALLIETL